MNEKEACMQIREYYCKECNIYFQKNQLTGTIGKNDLLCPECNNLIEIREIKN